MYVHQVHLFMDAKQVNIDGLQLRSDGVWQVAKYGSSLMEACKCKSRWFYGYHLCTVCRAKYRLN